MTALTITYSPSRKTSRFMPVAFCVHRIGRGADQACVTLARRYER
jgi:hypothetical protein